MKVQVLGGDGFCGWPTALHLSKLGHKITIVDNLSRRWIDKKMGADSLTPIATVEDRLAAWTKKTGLTIDFASIDVARSRCVRSYNLCWGQSRCTPSKACAR